MIENAPESLVSEAFGLVEFLTAHGECLPITNDDLQMCALACFSHELESVESQKSRFPLGLLCLS